MSERKHNRAAFPRTAAVVDAWREVFGADTRLLYAEEDGKTIGRKFEDRLLDDEHQEKAA